MKTQLLQSITLFSLAALMSVTNTVSAATVSVGTIEDIYVADVLTGSSNSSACDSSKTVANCDFIDANGNLLNDSELAGIVTGNPATYASSSATGNGATFDLGFSSFNLYNGEGDDLVVFIVGNGSTFDLDVFDTTGGNLLSDSFNVTVSNTVFDSAGNWLCVNGEDNVCTNGYPLSAVLIDFGDGLAGDVAIDSLRITLNDAEISMAGGFHVTPVPLPLPAVLFGSGLAMLGWVGRRRKK